MTSLALVISGIQNARARAVDAALRLLSSKILEEVQLGVSMNISENQST
jgi:hypothetical protein